MTSVPLPSSSTNTNEPPRTSSSTYLQHTEGQHAAAARQQRQQQQQQGGSNSVEVVRQAKNCGCAGDSKSERRVCVCVRLQGWGQLAGVSLQVHFRPAINCKWQWCTCTVSLRAAQRALESGRVAMQAHQAYIAALTHRNTHTPACARGCSSSPHFPHLHAECAEALLWCITAKGAQHDSIQLGQHAAGSSGHG